VGRPIGSLNKPKPFSNAFNLAIRACREHRGRAKQNGSAIPFSSFVVALTLRVRREM
jgi:hypothetical protein